MKKDFKKYLGIDWGEKRIGLSIADGETKIAIPYKVAKDIEEISKIIKTEGINEIIVGLPTKLNNKPGKNVELTRNFISGLKKTTALPVVEIDERLTSKGADALCGDKKTKASRDAIAAMLILQTFLDKL